MMSFMQRLNQFLRGALYFFGIVVASMSFAQKDSQPLLQQNDNGLRFHQSVNVKEGVLVQSTPAFISEEFNLDRSFSIVKGKEIEDGDELHVRFYIYKNSVKVLGSEVIGHYKNGVLYAINGHLYSETSGEKLLSLDEARDISLKSVGALSYKWQSKEDEQMLKIWKEDTTATYFPKGELVYCPKGLDFKEPHVLCYQYEIYSEEPLTRINVFVNAQTGVIWARENLLHVGDVQGTANTKYRGVQNIVADSVGVGSYRLRETGRGGGVETYNMQTGTNYGAAVDFTDTDNYWNNFNASFDEVAGDAHFGAEMTYDYLQDKFSRNSFDGNGAKIRSYVHYRSGYSNAFWNGSVMTYGDGNGTTVTPLTSIDVCGHEIAHAVTTNSAGLIYSYQSGALNESFSDIFGNAIEYFADSTQFNWRIGEDILTSGNGIRNMANPNTHGDPDTYLGTYWYGGTGDNGGVHTNSGVQNFWFYLLTEGGSGTNDIGDSYTVDSLGIHKAEQIAYRNLTVYLTASSDYADARYYGIQSAADLYGSCSNEVVATTNAWYAVGVGAEYDSSIVVAEFEADTLYCTTDEAVHFMNRSLNTKSYSWDFGDGNSSTQRNPIHYYSQQGYYSVELIAEGCYFGIYDTIEKINYIHFDSTRDICRGYLLPFGQWDTVHACNGFIYDHSGESNYLNRFRDTLTVDFSMSDSAHLTFEEFSYETNWDSIYIYDGYNTSGTFLGGFTGTALPNLGNPISFYSGAITITHFSDPYVVGSGFKAEFETFRPPVQLNLTPDTTVCFMQNIEINAVGSGGSRLDYAYFWNGVRGDSSFNIIATTDTVIHLKFGDECIEQFIEDSVVILVRDSLKLLPLEDTTLCYLETISLNATAIGGKSSDYQYKWLPFNITSNPWLTQFSADTTISVTISDGCTQQADTVSFKVTVREPINFNKSNDTLICQGGNVNLTLNGLGGKDTYWFTSSLGASSGPQTNYSENVSPIGSGLHHYWISLTDQCTETLDTAFYQITVQDSLSLDLMGDTTICYGTNASLKAIASGGVNGSYLYNWGSGYVVSNTQSFGPQTTTQYVVQIKDGCSVYEPKDSVVITVLDSITVSINAKDTSCYGEQITFSSTVNGGIGTNYNYNWDNSSGLGATYQKGITADQIISLTVGDGCTLNDGNASHAIKVREALSVSLPQEDEICLGDSIDISATASGGVPAAYNLTWDNSLGSGFSKTVNPNVTTVYTATLQDNCSFNASDQITITVNPKPIVSFDVNPNPYCTNREVVFSNTTPNSGASTFLWSFGDGITSNSENANHQYNNADDYTITLIVANEFGCVDSLVKQNELQIMEHPKASFSYTPTVANFLDPQFYFTNTSNNANNYYWYFGDGGSSSEQNPAYYYGDIGFYEVTLIADNDYGCPDTVVQTVEVEEVFFLYVPNAFSPNGDLRNDNYGVKHRGIVRYNIKIYNRWGEQLWSANNPDDVWDGKTKDNLVQQDIYFYIIEGVDFEGNSFKRVGNIMVVL
jgi:gliding motility-associated-like protein